MRVGPLPFSELFAWCICPTEGNLPFFKETGILGICREYLGISQAEVRQVSRTEAA